MEIQKAAVAGTLESSDAQVTVEPGAGGVQLELSSSVMNQYGRQIRATVLETLERYVTPDTDLLEMHDIIDHIEREIQQKFGIETTAHMDPIATDDESVNRLREQVAALARAVEPEMTIHDFRVTKGPQHTNLIFDVVVPHRCRLRDEELCERLSGAVRALDERYFAVIQVDRAYVETR